MLRAFSLFLLLSFVGMNAIAKDHNKLASSPDNPRVYMKTDSGEIVIELFPKYAPVTVANFLEYVDSGFYVGTIFHRVVDDFVVQGGGLTFDFQRKPPREPIKNESDNKLLNLKGTLSMARTAAPDSATSEFFINLKHNTNLDASKDAPGYAVFGKVVEGFDVVNKIVKEPRGIYARQGHPDAPNYPVRILEMKRLEPSKESTDKPAKAKTQ